MSRQKIIYLVIGLLVIGGTCGLLVEMKTKQRLGAPGIKTEPIAGKRNVKVFLPETVLSYNSVEVPQAEIVTNVLPADTSFAQRYYSRNDNSNDWMLVNVVLMGADRTSIHKPQFCLEGMGWNIDHAASVETKIGMDRPQSYELPVIKIVSSRKFADAEGRGTTYRGLYVYWYVADGVLSGDMSGRERMWGIAKNLLKTGELQRWAYISCFSVCLPGEEDATYERMKKFIIAAVPEFQLVPKSAVAVAAAKP